MPEDNDRKQVPCRSDRDLIPASEHLPSTELREDLYGYTDEETSHLRDYLDVIIRRKWMIISVLMLIFTSTLILTLASPRLYNASATIQISATSQKVTKFEGLVNNKMRARDYYVTQIKLLQNRNLARRVIDRIDLANHSFVVNNLFGGGNSGTIDRLKKILRDWVKQFISVFRAKDKEIEKIGSKKFPEEDVIKKKLLTFLARGLRISPIRNSTLIKISFTSPDRNLSKTIANTFAEEFILWKMDQKIEASQIARNFLMKQIDQAKINLEKSEEELNHFAKQAGIVSLDSKLNSIYRQLEELNSALAEAHAELIGKEVTYRQATQSGPSNLPQVMDSEIITGLKREYARLRSEYEELTTTFHGDYPKVKPLQTRMLSLAARLEAEIENIYQAIKVDYKTTLKKTNTLQTRVDEQKKLALNLNDRTTQYRIMERQVKTNKGIYDSLLLRVREIEFMVGVTSSDIQVVETAALPPSPFKPNVKRNLLLAIVVGLVAGIGGAFFLEYFSDKITYPEEISDRFLIPVLGVTPMVNNGDRPIEELVTTDPRSAFSEALRTIMISIQLSGLSNRSKSILLTSSMPSEGKTTLATNLALTFAGAGEKVILVDADLRRPRAHKILETADNTNHQGLSSFLSGIDEECVVCSNGNENLCFLPTGPLPPNPVELLASDRFADLMESLRSQYDTIIVDGPPISGIADVLVLSQHVGGVVFVASIGQTTRRSVRFFKKSILSIRGNILGCIVNKVNFSSKYSYYRSYYQHNPAYSNSGSKFEI